MEIGNAFSAMCKQNRVSMKEADKGVEIFKTIPIRYIEPDFSKILYFQKKTTCMPMMHIFLTALSGIKHLY